jgi:H/ACA ribonucleoprotein complex non-core subunit NAF1
MEGGSSDGEGGTSSDAAAAEGGCLQERVALVLRAAGDGERVGVELTVQFQLTAGGAGAEGAMQEDAEDEEGATSSSSSEEDTSSEEEAEEITDYAELRGIIDAMDDDDDGGGGGGADGGGGPGFGGRSAAAELFGAAPPPSVAVEVGEGEALTPAGSVLSVIEGTVVVRAAGGSRALNEGAVLVLEDRSVLGAVEDIFGPVTAPLYALRCAAEGPAVAPGARVFSVDRLAQYVLPDELRVLRGGDADLGEDGEPVDPELQFSDDEAVGVWVHGCMGAWRDALLERCAAVCGGGCWAGEARVPLATRDFAGARACWPAQ